MPKSDLQGALNALNMVQIYLELYRDHEIDIQDRHGIERGVDLLRQATQLEQNIQDLILYEGLTNVH
jgi:hypothetical protein